MPKFTKGQTVVVLPSPNDRFAPHETTITRVGRKYAYIERYRREVAYDIESGREITQYAGSYLRTLEEHADRERRSAAEVALRGYGFDAREYSGFTQSTETLEKIVAVLAEADE